MGFEDKFLTTFIIVLSIIHYSILRSERHNCVTFSLFTDESTNLMERISCTHGLIANEVSFSLWWKVFFYLFCPSSWAHSLCENLINKGAARQISYLVKMVKPAGSVEHQISHHRVQKSVSLLSTQLRLALTKCVKCLNRCRCGGLVIPLNNGVAVE